MVIFVFLKINIIMLKKIKVQEIIKAMPEQFSIDELLDKLILIQKVEEGLKDIEEGRVLTTEEAKNRLGKWLK